MREAQTATRAVALAAMSAWRRWQREARTGRAPAGPTPDWTAALLQACEWLQECWEAEQADPARAAALERHTTFRAARPAAPSPRRPAP